VGARATRETIEASERPVAFTHVNLHAYHPVPRNKTDEEIRALAARGGVLGINAVARLLSPHGRERGATLDEFLDQIDLVAELVGPQHVGLGLDINEGMTEESFLARRKGFLAKYPELRFGGDFAFEHYYVTGLSTMANMRSITAGLLGRGWAQDDVIGVLGGNFMRLLGTVWDAA
jgi:membrane dipeptidase